MSRTANSVAEGMLELESGKVVEIGTNLWFQSLEQIKSFRFEGSAGTFTARKERPLKRKAEDTGSGEPEYSDNAAYWYAYRKVEGKTRKRYIGKTLELTQQRLEEVAALLDSPTERKVKPQELPIELGSSDVRLLENKLWIAQENNKSLQAENEELKAKLLKLEEQLEKSKQIEKEMNQLIADLRTEVWLTKESLRIAQKPDTNQETLERENAELHEKNGDLGLKIQLLEEQLEQMKSQAKPEITDRDRQQTLVTGYDLLNIIKGKNPKTKTPVKELCWIAEAINDGTIIPGDTAEMVKHYKKEAQAMSEAFHKQHDNYTKLRDRTVGKKSGW